MLGPRIGLFELIFNPHLEKHQTETVCFLKKNQIDQEKVEKIKVKDYDQHNGAQNLRPQFSQLFLDQIDLFQKTDWLSLVFLHMWVEYELKWTYSRA